MYAIAGDSDADSATLGLVHVVHGDGSSMWMWLWQCVRRRGHRAIGCLRRRWCVSMERLRRIVTTDIDPALGKGQLVERGGRPRTGDVAVVVVPHVLRRLTWQSALRDRIGVHVWRYVLCGFQAKLKNRLTYI